MLYKLVYLQLLSFYFTDFYFQNLWSQHWVKSRLAYSFHSESYNVNVSYGHMLHLGTSWPSLEIKQRPVYLHELIILITKQTRGQRRPWNAHLKRLCKEGRQNLTRASPFLDLTSALPNVDEFPYSRKQRHVNNGNASFRFQAQNSNHLV